MMQRFDSCRAREYGHGRDALRFVEEERVINHDFILCTADIVSNVDLSGAILKHKQRRKKDKLCVATLCFARRKDARGREIWRLGVDVRVGREQRQGAVRAQKNRTKKSTTTTNTSITTNDEDEYKIVAFKESKGGVTKSAGGQLNIDAALSSEREDVEVETNARDLCVYICSPEVLMLFTDNFDYQSIRKDFVCGILSEARN